jgi:fatty acid desaturase
MVPDDPASKSRPIRLRDELLACSFFRVVLICSKANNILFRISILLLITKRADFRLPKVVADVWVFFAVLAVSVAVLAVLGLILAMFVAVWTLDVAAAVI